eukprot:148920-Rhodomonas_salina.2
MARRSTGAGSGCGVARGRALTAARRSSASDPLADATVMCSVCRAEESALCALLNGPARAELAAMRHAQSTRLSRWRCAALI